MAVNYRKETPDAGSNAVTGRAGAGNGAAEQLIRCLPRAFAALNPPFEQQWAKDNGDKLTIKQSHAGSSKQALAILQD